MAKRKRRRKSRTPSGRMKMGRAYACRVARPSNCTVKIGSRRYKAKSCITQPIKVCPTQRGRRRQFKMVTSGGGLATLYKVAKKRRARARRR